MPQTAYSRSRTDLEHMECLKLNVFALVSEQIHHHLEVRLVGDVARHHVEIRTIQQNLSQQLQGLSFRDVVLRHDQSSE